MYSVFVKMLLTDQGKKILREHQGDKNAQKVYTKFSAHAIKSMNDLLNSYELLTYITSACVGDGSWRVNT